MINTDDDYPPLEGQITSNPDDGEAYTVTIPFLGVQSSDGPKLVAGEAATIAPATLAEPRLPRLRVVQLERSSQR